MQGFVWLWRNRDALRTIIGSQDYILAIIVLINDNPMELINVYAPNKVEAPCFLATDQALRDSLLAGDFNPNHKAYDGVKAMKCDGVLRRSSRRVDTIVEWTRKDQYVLINSIRPPPISSGWSSGATPSLTANLRGGMPTQ